MKKANDGPLGSLARRIASLEHPDAVELADNGALQTVRVERVDGSP